MAKKQRRKYVPTPPPSTPSASPPAREPDHPVAAGSVRLRLYHPTCLDVFRDAASALDLARAACEVAGRAGRFSVLVAAGDGWRVVDVVRLLGLRSLEQLMPQAEQVWAKVRPAGGLP